jgi:hypothetical protein
MNIGKIGGIRSPRVSSDWKKMSIAKVTDSQIQLINDRSGTMSKKEKKPG